MVADIPILGELPLLMLIRNAVRTQTGIQPKVTTHPTAVIKRMGVRWSNPTVVCVMESTAIVLWARLIGGKRTIIA